MKTYKFTAEDPGEGAWIMGVAYHAVWAGQIQRLLQFAQNHAVQFEDEMDTSVPRKIEPVGYVLEEEDSKFEIGEPEREE